MVMRGGHPSMLSLFSSVSRPVVLTLMLVTLAVSIIGTTPREGKVITPVNLLQGAWPWAKPLPIQEFEAPPRIVPKILPKLYVFDHCEYCTRARMIFGLKNIAVDLVFIMYDKAEKLVKLAGKRITPVLELDEGEAILESLDIVKWVEIHNADVV
eukprot:jgi/Bigna1/77055/fgenesh1_pg.45_\